MSVPFFEVSVMTPALLVALAAWEKWLAGQTAK